MSEHDVFVELIVSIFFAGASITAALYWLHDDDTVRLASVDADGFITCGDVLFIEGLLPGSSVAR